MERRIGNFLESIPGYNGYRSKEDRRADDRRLRESIAQRLSTTVDTLTSVSAKLAASRNLTQISTVERLVGSTRQLADRVRTASYGYGGIFTDRDVDEFALDQLRQFDAAFQGEADALDKLANRIARSTEGPLEADLTGYGEELTRLGTLFDARSAVVDTARPNKDAAVLDLLETPEPPKESPLAMLEVGDTLSILGDNYIVDATVTFVEQDRQVNLSRVGASEGGKSIWLVGGTTADGPSAKLVEGDGSHGSSGAGRTAQAVIHTGTDAREGVPAEYGYTATTGKDVGFWYAIGSETRTFSGTTLEDADISVYGQA